MKKSQNHLIIELAAKERIFTTAQAKRMGITRDSLSKACATGFIKRLGHGVYSFSVLEDTPVNQLTASWKLTNPQAFSDERSAAETWDGIAACGLSAAYFNGFYDELTPPYHFCTPKRFNSRKRNALFKTRQVDYSDIRFTDGLPYTSKERTLVDLIIDSDRESMSHTSIAEVYGALIEGDFDSERFAALLSEEMPKSAEKIIDVLSSYNGNKICDRCWNYANPSKKLNYCDSCRKKRRIKQGTVAVVAITVVSGILYAILRNSEDDELQEIEIEDLDSLNEDFDIPEDFMSESDHEKLEEALSSGKVYSFITDAYMYEMQTGKLTVDDFLRAHNAESIVDKYDDWRDKVSSLSVDQFERAVQHAKDDVNKVKSISIDSNNVIHAVIESNSGKQPWGASFDFTDPEDSSFSSKCRYSADYPYAGVPQVFIREMRKWLKYETEQLSVSEIEE